jgi:hypothetical protein
MRTGGAAAVLTEPDSDRAVAPTFNCPERHAGLAPGPEMFAAAPRPSVHRQAREISVREH